MIKVNDAWEMEFDLYSNAMETESSNLGTRAVELINGFIRRLQLSLFILRLLLKLRTFEMSCRIICINVLPLLTPLVGIRLVVVQQ